jgi:hypothetical protein
VRREHLEHVLRAACTIAKADAALVIGSQAILGSFTEDVLPEAAVRSFEVDVTFFDDPADERSDQVDGAIGELSQFHETFGYYAQGVSVTTAVYPSGWQDRLVTLDTPSTAPGRGLCLEPHDLVASKLAAYREKDLEFAAALVSVGLVDPPILCERISLLPVSDSDRQRLREWVTAAAARS